MKSENLEIDDISDDSEFEAYIESSSAHYIYHPDFIEFLRIINSDKSNPQSEPIQDTNID
jgi:hypothetical protein